MYLLDTNIFLELLLDQAEARSVQDLLLEKNPADLKISDLAFHSIGIILYRKNAANLFSEFVHDLFGDDGISILRLDSRDMDRVRQVAEESGFDFDDAYQYVVVEKFDLVLVSFDAHFDRTARKRIIPADIH